MKTVRERAHEYLRFGSKLGLERMEALCAMLGNPEKKLRVIHVAGTNGKGSVCRYIYETLRAFGYTAGIFTSPYVGDFRERIEANGEIISEGRLEEIAEPVFAAAEILAGKGDPPTEFEVVTMLGLRFFAEEKLDFTVLEVGLGGRGDSTNVVPAPLVSIITHIALDHMDRLGDTEEKIAWEKAGIIKKGRPVVCGAKGAAAKVISGRANELGAPLIDSSKIEYRIVAREFGGYSFDMSIGDRHYNGVELSMAGEHQVQNAVTAICALDLLRGEKLLEGDDEALYRGMKKARLEARFHILSEDPPVIYDGAHNPDGARALAKTLRDLFPGKRILFVCSILRDKAAAEILVEFASVAASFIATESSNENSLSAGGLAGLIEAAGGTVEAVIPAPDEAYSTAMDIAKDAAKGYDALVFAGSLYLFGDLIQNFGREK